MSENLVQTATLKALDYKGRTVLVVDTGQRADSLEGLRLVKASRGTGWVWHQGRLEAWETKGVLQDERRLVVWGETELLLDGLEAAAWPLAGSPAWEFQKELARAWTAVAGKSGLHVRFDPSAVLVARREDSWLLAFVPRDLAGVLTSVLPLSERAAWEPFLHPDGGERSWAFASAALLWRTVEPQVPWEQPEESFLRQEIRDLAKTLTAEELPAFEPVTTALLLASLGKPSTPTKLTLTASWAAWTETAGPFPHLAPREGTPSRTRLANRQRHSFWRRRGTVILVSLAITGVLAAIVGSAVWNNIGPHPTDNWQPQQVVEGYYQALDGLDTVLIGKLTDPEGKQPVLSADEELCSNLYVLIQVRVSYERQSPRVDAQKWEDAGKPPVQSGQMLYGLARLVTSPGPAPDQWTAEYHQWSMPGTEGPGMQPAVRGELVRDVLTLKKTWKGWKIVALERESRPLPSNP